MGHYLPKRIVKPGEIVFDVYEWVDDGIEVERPGWVKRAIHDEYITPLATGDPTLPRAGRDASGLAIVYDERGGFDIIKPGDFIIFRASGGYKGITAKGYRDLNLIIDWRRANERYRSR